MSRVLVKRRPNIDFSEDVTWHVGPLRSRILGHPEKMKLHNLLHEPYIIVYTLIREVYALERSRRRW